MTSIMRFLCLFSCSVVYILALEERFIFDTSNNPLVHYNVDKSQISVSGISSGAAFASQFHVIYSSHVMGAGLIAGAPYGCARGNAVQKVFCLRLPTRLSVTHLESQTSSDASAGIIDPTTNLTNDRVYIFDGTRDTIVNPAIGPVLKEYYRHFIHNPANVKTVLNVPAEHGQPTENFGVPCGQLNTTLFMNDCNYSAAYDLLNHIYGGNLKKPTANTVLHGQLRTFDQLDLFVAIYPGSVSVDRLGYVYVSHGCLNRAVSCKLHVVFHGCDMGWSELGETFIRHAGYNEVGELNNIIILYPQALTKSINPQDCWDWSGFTGSNFATKQGPQVAFIKRMIDRVTG